MKFLNKKDIKNLQLQLEAQFGIKSLPNYVYIQKDNEIYISNRDIEKVNLSDKSIRQIGLLFANIKDREILLTIEGSQLIGKEATKNIIELNDEQLKDWFKGDDIETNINSNRVLLKYKHDFLGTAKVRNNKILNSLLKSRRTDIV